jgi:hypothetical protein
MGPPTTWRGQFGARWWPAGRVERSPPTQPSPPRVDTWQPRLEPNHLKPWPAGQGAIISAWDKKN